MSLATRCSACGTVFRVVEDQLKISEGWVRCGRCKEVFNALESLFDLEREAPPEWRPRPDPGEAVAEPPAGEASPFSMPRNAAGNPAAPERAARAPSRPSARPSAPPSPASRSFESPEPDDDQADEPLLEPSWAVSRFSPMPASGDDAEAAGRSADAPAPPPGFLRHASRGWQQRLLDAHRPWAAAVLVLALLLVGQMAYRSRNALAADWPATRPLFAVACAITGCTLEAPRRIEDIAVESSTLMQAEAGAGSDAMRLSVVLRNRGSVALAMPTIDLSLTDSNGELVARRALSGSDFHVAGATLPPSAETPLQLLMSTGGRRVSGYTVEVFYP